ncbi:MAG: alpha/beta hydrolase, partial [Proteobacteria bacterium]|nr:alpha/beta hydrolase [Pseudomonadota bacterium]
MATITPVDGIERCYEEAGDGIPMVFVHEFAGDYRSFEPQMRHFARRYRCI